MAIDPSQGYAPWNPFNPSGGLFSPFGSYFLPPPAGAQGLSLAPYSQQTWYGFSPWAQGGGGFGAGSGATPANLWALYQTLFPAGNAIAGYSFAGAPRPTPPITTPVGPAFDALPPIPTVFAPPGPAAPPAVPAASAAPVGTALTFRGEGSDRAFGGEIADIDRSGPSRETGGGRPAEFTR
jgi:hypothetical protein